MYDVPLIHGVCGGRTGGLKSVHCQFVFYENPAMPSLRIIAHGSRRAASSDEVRQLAVQVRVLAGNAYDDGERLSWKQAEPSIPDGRAARLKSWRFPIFSQLPRILP